MTKPRKLKPEKESKRDAFVRIGEKRMKVLIKAMRLLGNLSNHSAYEYSQDDVEKMADALITEIAEFRNRMENRKRSMGFSFRLDEEGYEADKGEQKAA